MKNLTLIFTVAFLFALTSCTKEELIQPEIDVQDQELVVSNHIIPVSEIEIEPIFEEASMTVNELQVSKVSYSEVDGELLIGFSTDFDFSSSVLESAQELKFIDCNNNESTFVFGVNDFDYDSNVLSVAFAINGNSLAGLTLKTEQSIIILDDVID